MILFLGILASSSKRKVISSADLVREFSITAEEVKVGLGSNEKKKETKKG